MHKKLSKHDNLNKKTPVEKISRIENNQQFKKALQQVMDDYAEAFEKLAK